MRIDQLADRINANEDTEFYRTFMLGIYVGVLAYCYFFILMEKERKETSTLQTMPHSDGDSRITKNEEDSDGEGSDGEGSDGEGSDGEGSDDEDGDDEDGDGDCPCSKH
jgi:hypothetical protein